MAPTVATVAANASPVANGDALVGISCGNVRGAGSNLMKLFELFGANRRPGILNQPFLLGVPPTLSTTSLI